MRTAAWLAAVVASAALAIAAGDGLIGSRWLFVFKPLTTLLVIGFAWGRGADDPSRQRWIRIGLLLSLAGDVALLWPVQGFLPGLVAFLLAHLAYIVAFTRGVRFAVRRLPFAAYAVVAGGVLAMLWPSIPAPLRGPVAAYVLCLASMAAQAACVGRVAALGGALFMASDALLAFDRFAEPLPLSSLLVLATYWAAQCCIAASLRRTLTSP